VDHRRIRGAACLFNVKLTMPADALDQVRIDRPAWRIEGDPDAASASDDGETALSS